MIIARKYFSDNKKEGETKRNNTGKIVGVGLIGSGTAIGGGLLSGHLVRKAHKKALDAEIAANTAAKTANDEAARKASETITNKVRKLRNRADDIAADIADAAEKKLGKRDIDIEAWNSVYDKSYKKNTDRVIKASKSMREKMHNTYRSNLEKLDKAFEANKDKITNKFNKIGKAGKVGAVVLGAGAGLGAYKLMNKKKKGK